MTLDTGTSKLCERISVNNFCATFVSQQKHAIFLILNERHFHTGKLRVWPIWWGAQLTVAGEELLAEHHIPLPKDRDARFDCPLWLLPLLKSTFADSMQGLYESDPLREMYEEFTQHSNYHSRAPIMKSKTFAAWILHTSYIDTLVHRGISQNSPDRYTNYIRHLHEAEVSPDFYATLEHAASQTNHFFKLVPSDIESSREPKVIKDVYPLLPSVTQIYHLLKNKSL